MYYYTSDLHLGQKSLLSTGKFKERPFATLDEMHETIINRWNNKVNNGDHVFILGDVGARGYKNMHPEILAQLKGSKHLILGNHDDVSDLRIRQQFVEICNYKKITDNSGGNNRNVCLSHFPIMMWEGQHRGAILLYGHLHDTEEELLFQKYLAEYNQDRLRNPRRGEEDCLAFNVGMCLWNYEPVSLDEILKNGNKNQKIRMW